MEILFDNACGLDVQKNIVVRCVMRTAAMKEFRTFSTMTLRGIKDLNEHLAHDVAQRTEELLFSMEELKRAQEIENRHEDGSSIAGKYIGLKPLQDTHELITFTIIKIILFKTNFS
jgi:hypothetical protein